MRAPSTVSRLSAEESMMLLGCVRALGREGYDGSVLCDVDRQALLAEASDFTPNGLLKTFGNGGKALMKEFGVKLVRRRHTVRFYHIWLAQERAIRRDACHGRQ